jgi:hypothetical protein
MTHRKQLRPSIETSTTTASSSRENARIHHDGGPGSRLHLTDLVHAKRLDITGPEKFLRRLTQGRLFAANARKATHGNVRFGSKADIERSAWDVRFTPESGHFQRRLRCPLSANSGHYGADRELLEAVTIILELGEY